MSNEANIDGEERYPDEADFNYVGGPLDRKTGHTYPEIHGVEWIEEYHVRVVHHYNRVSSTEMKFSRTERRVIIDDRLDRNKPL